MRLLFIFLAVATLSLGCRKRRPTDGSTSAAPEPVPPEASQTTTPSQPATTPAKPNLPEEPKPDHQIMLSRALFSFQGKNGRPPKDWQELISTGYLKQMPAAPPGKRYTFDRSLNVHMVNQ